MSRYQLLSDLLTHKDVRDGDRRLEYLDYEVHVLGGSYSRTAMVRANNKTRLSVTVDSDDSYRVLLSTPDMNCNQEFKGEPNKVFALAGIAEGHRLPEKLIQFLEGFWHFLKGIAAEDTKEKEKVATQKVDSFMESFFGEKDD